MIFLTKSLESARAKIWDEVSMPLTSDGERQFASDVLKKFDVKAAVRSELSSISPVETRAAASVEASVAD